MESKKLEKYSGILRVDAVASLKPNDRYVPQAKILLSEIKEEGIDTPLRFGVSTGKTVEIIEPLNRISDYLIGSCWLNGQRISRLSPFENTFTIDTSEVRFFKPTEKITLDSVEYANALPQKAINLSSNFKEAAGSTLYAVVPVINNDLTKYLVIPCSELYRFYIGVSDQFINTVVVNQQGKYFSWEKPYIKIKTPLSRLEQFVAYRGCHNSDGQDWLMMPSNHIKSIAMTNQSRPEIFKTPLLLKATFPFKGITTLTIAGKKFNYKSGANECWSVFVANILECSRKENFDVRILSDLYSESPAPWEGSDSADDVATDDPFDLEDEFNESDSFPDVYTKPMSVLNSSNRFSAMNGMVFQHFHTDESIDPVYGNPSEDALNGYSHEDLSSVDEDNVLKKRDFESHVDKIDRQLSDFIRMVIQLRGLVSNRAWRISTRATQSVLEVEGELVTTFLTTSNKRRTWHLIQEGQSTRLRQVAWVEIALNNNQFIYLIEMELKGSEEGRSTMCIVRKGFGYMLEQDFKVFLAMTAAKNRWPKSTHGWKTKESTQRAKVFFGEYELHPITHSEYLANRVDLNVDNLSKWAKDTVKNLLNIRAKYLEFRA